MDKDDIASTRETLHVPLQRQAREIMERMKEQTGVAKTEAATRIFEWFFSLDPRVQTAVMRRDPNTRQEMARAALQEMLGVESVAAVAGQSVASLSLEQAVQMIGALATHAGRQLLAQGKKKRR